MNLNMSLQIILVQNMLMVNSGSSANLLAAFALVNPLKNHLNIGDEFLIQSLCWSTSLWPMVQAGLRPKFIDVNIRTLNIEPEEFYESITKNESSYDCACSWKLF